MNKTSVLQLFPTKYFCQKGQNQENYIDKLAIESSREYMWKTDNLSVWKLNILWCFVYSMFRPACRQKPKTKAKPRNMSLWRACLDLGFIRCIVFFFLSNTNSLAPSMGECGFDEISKEKYHLESYRVYELLCVDFSSNSIRSIFTK